MITEEFARDFAQKWIESWNSHDLDKILAYYTDDFVINTPMAAVLKPDSGGVVEGELAVREYWQVGLSRIPDLRFDLLDVLSGVQSVTIYYVNTATNRRSVEMMFFSEAGKVNRAFVNYAG
ncbi:nuclear transport factor 2 family protein [Spirosoma sp. KNUC1025]|uniref:nuclear transport factor 2 family protein n=1 Tax=Spirosoma sp. KNUC1025 TaxID=2894082 RepID=UPI003867B29D|nr:nuclear transport factor 2 family protein [Spirosoma sp. KNUC1025]